MDLASTLVWCMQIWYSWPDHLFEYKAYKTRIQEEIIGPQDFLWISVVLIDWWPNKVAMGKWLVGIIIFIFLVPCVCVWEYIVLWRWWLFVYMNALDIWIRLFGYCCLSLDTCVWYVDPHFCLKVCLCLIYGIWIPPPPKLLWVSLFLLLYIFDLWIPQSPLLWPVGRWWVSLEEV